MPVCVQRPAVARRSRLFPSCLALHKYARHLTCLYHDYVLLCSVMLEAVEFWLVTHGVGNNAELYATDVQSGDAGRYA